jgi:transcriptional regulator with XRE-family HTH domain
MAERPRSFSERLRSLREAAGLSQYALAKRAGLSKQALSRLESEAREPNWVTVQRLAAALGQSCEAFADPDIASDVQIEPPRPRGRPPKARPLDVKGQRARKRK